MNRDVAHGDIEEGSVRRDHWSFVFLSCADRLAADFLKTEALSCVRDFLH